MVVHQQHHLRFHHQLRKAESEQRQQQQQLQLIPDSAELHLLIAHYDHILYRKSSLAVLRLLILSTLITCSLLLIPRLLSFTAAAVGVESTDQEVQPMIQEDESSTSTSTANYSSMFCDRSAYRTDVCFMRGDVRTHSSSDSILLLARNLSAAPEKIRPYTRKWETGVMDTIDELHLRPVDPDRGHAPPCDVRHDVPAVIFSTGGYTGNVYHDFNDGIIPLYITSRLFDRKVVLVVLDYHQWWVSKYGGVLSRLSDYPPIDFARDRRTHCFPEAIVGLKIHDELAVDPARMENNETIADFRRLLDDAYRPRVQHVERKANSAAKSSSKKPKLVVVLRDGSRAIENEGELVAAAQEVGFRVKVLRPRASTPLARIYEAVSSCDSMVGVHGAAMTHMLFMRPGAVFVQIVPVGTDWAAAEYYGEPAAKMGLRYVAYRILPRESSLRGQYGEGDPVLRDPESVNAKGWEMTKKVYLDQQKVRLDLVRFRKSLVGVHRYLASRRKAMTVRWKHGERPQRGQ